MPVTHDYTIAMSFTGLGSLVNGAISGGKVFVRNRNTREVLYINAYGSSTNTIANALTSSKKFTTAFSNGDVIEYGMMGDEFGVGTHIVNLSKGGTKLTLAVTEVSTTTHPNVTL